MADRRGTDRLRELADEARALDRELGGPMAVPPPHAHPIVRAWLPFWRAIPASARGWLAGLLIAALVGAYVALALAGAAPAWPG